MESDPSYSEEDLLVCDITVNLLSLTLRQITLKDVIYCENQAWESIQTIHNTKILEQYFEIPASE